MGQLQDVAEGARLAAEITRNAAQAMQASAESQQRLTAATIVLRDTVRALADQMARGVRRMEDRQRRRLEQQLSGTTTSFRDLELGELLMRSQKTVLRAQWHVNAARACVTPTHIRHRARLYRSIVQTISANAELRELVAELVYRFPDQETTAAGIRQSIERTDAAMQQTLIDARTAAGIRTAQDHEPEEAE